MNHLRTPSWNRLLSAAVAALSSLIAAAHAHPQTADPAIYELPAAMAVPGTRLESYTASNPANSTVKVTPSGGATTTVTGKSVIMLKRVATDIKPVPGGTPGQTLGYVYDALVIDAVATIRPDRTLSLDRGKLFLNVDQSTVGQASAVPWWYPIVVGQSTQSGVISTEFVVQRKPMALGSDLERIFLVRNASNAEPPDVWVSRTLAPGGGGDPMRQTLAKNRSYVLVQENRNQPIMTPKVLNPTESEGEEGVANGVYDNAVEWAVRAGLHAP